MTSPTRRRSCLAVAAGVCATLMLSAVGACSRDGDGPAPVTVAPTTAAAARGDDCYDARGDILTNQFDDGSVTSEPAGIDITRARANVEGDQLAVSFRTVGVIDAAPDPEFLVANGSLESAPDLYWELRAKRSGTKWGVQLISFPKGLGARQQEKTINVPVIVESTELRYSVPLDQLPPISTILWMFGVSSGVSDESRVVDDCQPFNQTGSPEGIEPDGSESPAPGTTPSVPSISGSVGQTLTAPDGSKVTVRSIEVPAVPNNEQTPEPVPGTRFAAADVEVCAGSKQVDNVGEGRWSLEATAAGGERRVSAWDAPRSPKSPRFTAGATVRAGECVDGWVVFQIGETAIPVSVNYDTSGIGVGPLVVFRV